MKKIATLTTMAFVLSTVFAFAKAPASQDQPAPTTKSTKSAKKTHKKTSNKKTTTGTTAPAAVK